MLRPADKAWLTLAVGVVGYEIWAPRGELLSEGVDRYLEARPWLARVVVWTVAAHLLNMLPGPLDPLHWLSAIKR